MTLPTLSDAEIAEITALIQTLPGQWKVFPHLGTDGEATLHLAPALWDGEDAGVVMQPGPEGIRVMLVVADEIAELGHAGSVWAAVSMAWRAATRRVRHAIPAI
ncbi:hypothetical protein [Roseomonas sp. KE0001]|uniref:hypothetical protein n=1 Tax=unclassified Roseomonas TaxID=2617492 RepID=UPI0018DFCCAF|nr:hypothetical protein [Roseomonas sp. KE0001]MBI0435330.1 hypothetical protein [Roseomonas sp. KE0001]